MRKLGVAALIFTILSFLLWLVSWAYWTFLIRYYGESDALHYAAVALSFLSSLCHTAALSLVCFAVINAFGRNLPKE